MIFNISRKFLSLRYNPKTFPTLSLLRNQNSVYWNSVKNMSQKCLAMGDETSIVWMDLEMTGLDVINDKILELSCLVTDKDLNILVEGPSIAINYTREIFDNMNDWCKKHHNESGLVEKCLKSQITQQQGEEILLEFLKQHIPKGKCPLAGNSIYMDRLFLRQQMSSVDDYLHYRVIDVSTIKELASRWNPDIVKSAPEKRFAHRTLDDIVDSINELKYYKSTFFKGCA